MRALWSFLLLAACAPACVAQAKFTATGPGSYIALGVSLSGYQSDYGRQKLGGEAVFLDAHLYRRIGVEAEARQLNLHTSEETRETTYLVGPKLSMKSRTLRPYGKFLAGRGEFQFPFKYAQGSYFVMAPGAGLDWRLAESRFTLRVLDFEYQFWPGFTLGALHPYGASAGLSYRIF